MILYGSLTSPFVRACRIAALEVGIELDFEATVVKPTEPNRDFGASVNPLRRVPALTTDDGVALVDSRVILEHFNSIGVARGANALIPTDGAKRLACLNRHAVVTGAIEGLVSAMYETKFRPEAYRWPDWAADQIDKAQSSLDWVETNAAAFEDDFDIAAIGLVCLLGYVAFRFPDTEFMANRPRLSALHKAYSERPSVRETAPPSA